MEAERKISSGKRKLRCMNGNCPGILETQQERDYFYCDLCKDPENQKSQLDSEKNPEDFKEMLTAKEELNVAKEVLNNHIILYGAESYYKLLEVLW